mmetsp:Transcript_34308/g.79305  ORF Transcript_34308/g.79305 Transcript_34308/m.79305 type:complete len:146 (-) Transcript_34308:35-472(-)
MHSAMAHILSTCSTGHGGGGTVGRVQWDPSRDLMAAEPKKREPRKMLRARAIQIGMKGELSRFYVENTLSIEDVTALSRAVGEAHGIKNATAMNETMAALGPELPDERAYMPRCSEEVLVGLGMKRGATSESLSRIGKGKAHDSR